MTTHKLAVSAALALALAAPMHAQGPEGAGAKSKKPIVPTILAGAGCGLSIGLSANPAGAARVGVPILFGGALYAWKENSKHPKAAGLVLDFAGMGCSGATFIPRSIGESSGKEVATRHARPKLIRRILSGQIWF